MLSYKVALGPTIEVENLSEVIMENHSGILVAREMNVGSKSEGIYTFLTLEDGAEYMLYRKDVYPADDAFFAPYIGMSVRVTGIMDTRVNAIIVEELHLPDGTTVNVSKHNDINNSI